MKSPQRILIAHAETGARRILAVLLVEAGFDVLAVEPGPNMVKAARVDSFDLALVGCDTTSEDSLALAGELRANCPHLLIVMMLEELELSLVVKGIRQGLTDVLPLTGDHRSVVRRVMALLAVDVAEDDTSLHVGEIEKMVAELEPDLNAVSEDRHRSDLCGRLKHAVHELQCERERVAAAQISIDERARLLADERAELAGERTYVEQMADQVERDRTLLAEEQKVWRETQEDLKNCEAGLRTYEDRLRRLQAETEPPFAPLAATKTAAQLAQDWAALEKAQAALESERALFRDQRMLITELDNQIRQRESRLGEIEASIADRDRMRRGLPPPPPKALAKAVASPPPLPLPKPKLFSAQFFRKRSDSLATG
ncbi:hypothetical protein [Synoicihabitans lomoniglobus]|uniref:Response regulatory domain-containing protein n=1 Tax=Synoicihabitans lomoniglobus TaxID=2909285 RepID=A0AAE9ZZC9_9BACT|nr:hypothetical protein [Opitutaceae bacterium LMO-M01]WED64153.1 hypothetical protein PXH66_17585 [Opitutaceae bacterium LMO-M01]